MTAKTTAAQRNRIHRLVEAAATLPDVRTEVEGNHDNNRWWPISIADPRMRMLAAGWSTRVNYRMIGSYADVITKADAAGFEALAAYTDADITELARPIGLPQARIDYLRSLNVLIGQWAKDEIDPATIPQGELIQQIADQVHGASYKVAQCAVLYSRGYHCGIIPVDSGMVTKLAPALGFTLPYGPIAHERLRHTLESAVTHDADAYREMTVRHRHKVTIPDDATPTWWVHLVLIYFKRLYLNKPPTHLCTRRPLCTKVIRCSHTAAEGSGL
ncbi:hypothetical protein [Streptomyces sp. NPDC097981]|uniref:hypothetical protein n=1 Tax=Streptomyces sp. NPDC097981 TaxID=3155428 RepID=UPI003322EDDA